MAATVFTPRPKDVVVIRKWRDLLQRECVNKRIPKALVPVYCNEKVQRWIQTCGINQDLLDQEARYLSRIFIPTNWESMTIHPSKVACLLCVNVDSHSFDSAMFRVSDPHFLNCFMRAHYQDKQGDKGVENAILKGIYDFLDSDYTGRDIKSLFFLFLRDNPGFAVQFAFQIDEFNDS
jgi:hypothetical protein